MLNRIYSMMLFIASPFFLLNAQVNSSSFSGDWELNADQRFRFEDGKVFLLNRNSNGNFERYNKDKSYQLQQTGIVNRNNAIYSWINTCKECGWTETQTYMFAYINKYITRVWKVRIVNNVGALKDPYESWHSKKPQSSTKSTYFDITPVAKKRKVKPVVGAATSPTLTIQEVALHEQFTAVKFMLRNTTKNTSQYTLHKPGSDSAFMIQDMRGNAYKLIDEFGFGGFQSLSLEGNGTHEFTCYFEPIPIDTQTINLKEGDCSGSNCWNFYDVKLN